jgi:DNA replication and repair protein RecF
MITSLTLTNFRNHETLRIRAAGGVALSGPNGAGKTNALEAISLLSGSPGLRRAASADLARFGANEYAVAALLAGGTEVCVYWAGAGHRRAKINGCFTPLSDLAGVLGIVWLTPAEDLLFASAPSHRRAFLDNLVSGFDARHAARAARLSKLLAERAYALKNGSDGLWLDQIENNIALTASAVADARVRYASELNHFFAAGEIMLSGMLEQKIMNGEKAGDFEDFYRKYLSENRFLSADKMTIDGPHRSDFAAMNRALSLPADKTSSGQMKLILIELVIANARLLNQKNPDKPLLILLDEADSHLDESARARLFGELGKVGAQIWLTGTNSSAFADAPGIEIIEMRPKI